MKYYAVKKGLNTGIFTNWEECKKNVVNFKGAIYKSFKTKEEAVKFLEGTENKEYNENEKFDFPYAYIDGSFMNGKIGMGAVLVIDDEVYEYSDSVTDEKYLNFRNVAGELFAARYVLEFAVKNNIKDIAIFYDYSGIELWATGEWKAKNELTKEYADFYKEISTKVNVHFRKVKAHTGIKYNELADKLAKKGVL